MKQLLSRHFASFFDGVLVGLVFLFPLFVLPWTLDVSEINKQALLLLGVAVLVLAFVGRALVDREVVLVRGWVNILLLVLLGASFFSGVFSIAGSLSWLGGSLQEYRSVLTTAALVGLFFVVTHRVRKESMERAVFAAILASGVVAMGLMLTNLFGFSLFPWGVLRGVAFNTVGTVNAFAIFSIVVCVFGQALWLVSGRQEREVLLSGWMGWIEKVAVVFLTGTTLVVLLGLDFWVLWVLFLVGSGTLLLFGLVRTSEFPQTLRFLLPMASVVISVFFLFLPRPFGLALPVEVTPTFHASIAIWKETGKTYSWWLGSGPGTYAFDYARFREADVNQTVFWNTRFDRGHSHVMTLLTTEGILGLGVWVIFVLVILWMSLLGLLRERSHVVWKMQFVLLSAWLVLVTSGFLYAWNLTLIFLFYLLSGLLAAQGLRGRVVKLGSSPRVNLGLSFLFVIFSIGLLTLVFLTVERQMAERSFARAMRMDRSHVSLDEVVGALDRAATLNQYNDVYQRMLSEALLYRASELFDSRAGSTLTEEDTQILSRLSSASINAAKRSTDLSPFNGLNWLVRGGVYRELMPLIGGVDEFAKRSYERAILLEPQHPEAPTGLARVYLEQARVAERLQDAQDPAVRKEAMTNHASALASAETLLNQAVSLKPDYGPAHFYLALVYEEQGRLDEALAKLTAVAQSQPRDVGVLFQLGQLAMRAKQYDRAEWAFERAVELRPDFLNAHWFLASVYEIQGKMDQAIEQVRIVAEAEPDHPLVRSRLERLEEGEKTDTLEPLEENTLN